MVADAAPLLALAGLILVKESGVPVPVPGDLVVLGAGVAASRGDLDPVVAVLTLIIASVAGGAIQFGLLRSVARPALLRLLTRLASAGRVDAQTERLRRGGARGVAVARVTPGLRIVAIAASALAGVPAAAFLSGLIVGNGLFIAAHFGLGYALGAPVLTVVGGALGPLAALGLAVAAIGAIGWFVLSRRRNQPGGDRRDALTGAVAWADACCPACLALAATGRS
jgi:membrane protein DedA with SNARE-associated domain